MSWCVETFWDDTNILILLKFSPTDFSIYQWWILPMTIITVMLAQWWFCISLTTSIFIHSFVKENCAFFFHLAPLFKYFLTSVTTYFILKVIIQYYNYFSFLFELLHPLGPPIVSSCVLSTCSPFSKPCKRTTVYSGITRCSSLISFSKYFWTTEWWNKERNCTIRNSAPLWFPN